MKLRVIGFALAICGLAVAGCGDDEPVLPARDSGIFTPAAPAPVDAGSVADAATSTPSDAGVKRDAATADAGRQPPRSDAGATADAGTTKPVDAGSGPLVPVENTACLECEKTGCFLELLEIDAVKSCEAIVGNATAGTKKGTAKRKLCEDLVACAHRTRCAFPAVTNCLCGDKSFDDCVETAYSDPFKLTGACRDEYIAAAETLQGREIFEREKSFTEYGLGAAALLLECDAKICADACFDPCKGKPDQTLCGVAPGVDMMCGVNNVVCQTCTAGSCSIDDQYDLDGMPGK